MVRLLIHHGAIVDDPFPAECTPLGMAVSRDHVEVVRLLLEAGADVSAANKSGQQVLPVAVQKMHWEVVLLLLDAHPNISGTITQMTTSIIALK